MTRAGAGSDRGGGATGGCVAAGGGLVEILVALVVLEVGLLGVVGLLVSATRTVARAAAVERAATLAGGVADSLLAAPSVASGGAPRGELRVAWEAREDGVAVAVVGTADGDTLLGLFVPRAEIP